MEGVNNNTVEKKNEFEGYSLGNLENVMDKETIKQVEDYIEKEIFKSIEELKPNWGVVQTIVDADNIYALGRNSIRNSMIDAERITDIPRNFDNIRTAHVINIEKDSSSNEKYKFSIDSNKQNIGINDAISFLSENLSKIADQKFLIFKNFAIEYKNEQVRFEDTNKYITEGPVLYKDFSVLKEELLQEEKYLKKYIKYSDDLKNNIQALNKKV